MVKTCEFMTKTLPKSTGTLGIRESHNNDIDKFPVFVKVISEAILGSRIVQATQEQFTGALRLICGRVSHVFNPIVEKYVLLKL